MSLNDFFRNIESGKRAEEVEEIAYFSTEGLQSLADLMLHSLLRDAQFLSNLAVSLAIALTHQEHFTAASGQTVDGGP